MLFSLTLALSRWERETARPPLAPASLSWLLKGLPSACDGLRRSLSQREREAVREKAGLNQLVPHPDRLPPPPARLNAPINLLAAIPVRLACLMDVLARLPDAVEMPHKHV